MLLKASAMPLEAIETGSTLIEYAHVLHDHDLD